MTYNCSCSCNNITDVNNYIDLYNTTLALEIVRGQEYVFNLPLMTDVETISFNSAYFSGNFIKTDEGRWNLTMSKSDSSKLKLGIWPYTIKANNYYLYSGVMNVIDTDSSSDSISNESSEINKLISFRYLFKFKNEYTVSKDNNHVYVTYPFTKKNQDAFDDLISDLMLASNETRLQSVRFALSEFVDGELIPYSITQDINYDDKKISAEYYYVDDYVNGCDHLLFEFTHDKLVVSAKLTNDYYDNDGSEETFAQGISKLLKEYNFGEFLLIEKKSDTDNTITYSGGEGISINKNGVISVDLDDQFEKITDSMNDTLDQIDTINERVNASETQISNLAQALTTEQNIARENELALSNEISKINPTNILQCETFVVNNPKDILSDEDRSTVTNALNFYNNHATKIVSMLCGAIDSNKNVAWSTSNVSVIGYDVDIMAITSTTYNYAKNYFCAFAISKANAQLIDLKGNDWTSALSTYSIFLKIYYME